jgi:hypothetical protein
VSAIDRAGLELWLRANGAPWLVERTGVLRRLVSDLSGLVAIVGFAVQWFLTVLVRSRATLVGVLPLLLVAVVLSFFSTETWQTIGSLHGLPIVLVVAMFVVLGAAFVSRQAKPDLRTLAEFADAASLAAALPAAIQLPADAPDEFWRARPLTRAERANLLLVSVLAQVIAATVIALAVAAFFVLLGLLSVSEPVTANWLGQPANVLADFSLAGHEYAITSELLRVSVFLGTFAGFYFIVTATTDQRLREGSSADHDAHLRTVLAVRCVYRNLVVPPRRSPT